MNARKPVWLSVAVAALVAAPLAGAAVGRTVGTPIVSDTGEATYSIDIFAPPGTANMTPRLSLQYAHRNSGTIAGVGWSIGGLRTIDRCPRTFAQDGASIGVNLTQWDRYCLDGNQLKLFSGTYGQAGAEYRTEVETFSKVVSNGFSGTGPDSFTVWGNDGLIYDFGTRSDSRIEAVGTAAVRTWALSTIRDRRGNRIEYYYNEDTTLGGYRISEVHYTSNPGLGACQIFCVSEPVVS